VTPIAVALISGLLGAGATLGLERLKRKWDRDEQARKLINQYRDPLLRAAFDLQSRLYNIVVWDFLSLLRSDDETVRRYAVDTTAWHFAQYVGWVEILRHEVQFLDLGTARRNKQLQARLGSVAHAFASDRKGFEPLRESTTEPPPSEEPRAQHVPQRKTADLLSPRAAAKGPAFIIFRTDQRALGEAMFKKAPEGEDAARPDCLTFSEFAARLAAHDDQSADPLERWFQRFRSDLEEFARGGWDKEHPRLIAIQNSLIDLIDLLDPEQERFPDRNSRGKIPAADSSYPRPYRLAYFVWRDDPWEVVTQWAGRYKAVEVEDERSSKSRSFVRPARTRLGVTLFTRVDYDEEAPARWLSVEGWTRLPRPFAWLRPALLAGTTQAAEPDGPASGGESTSSSASVARSGPPGSNGPETRDDTRGRLPLEGNSIFFATSQRRAHHAANRLLERFGRPRVVADPVPKRQYFFVGAPLLLVAGIAAGLAMAAGSDAGRAVQSGTTVSSLGTSSSIASTGTGDASAGTSSTPTSPASTPTSGAGTTQVTVTETETAPGVTTTVTETTSAPTQAPVSRARIGMPPSRRRGRLGCAASRSRSCVSPVIGARLTPALGSPERPACKPLVSGCLASSARLAGR
jgi:hypothetical protein